MPPTVDRGALEFAALVRRRSARIPVNGRVRVSIQGLDLPVELRDLSFGGFAIRAARPFIKWMTHAFTFSTASGGSVTLVAKAVHCYAVPDEPRFVSGWEFMKGTADQTERAIGRLLSAVS